MRPIRIATWFGWILIVLSLAVVIVDGVQMNWAKLGYALIAAAVVGLVVGLFVRRRFTLDQRLRAAHRLNPVLARRLLPPPGTPRPGDEERDD